MTREQARETIKAELEGYLTSKGINTSKPFRCLNPDHIDNNPSMSYDKSRNKAHCFRCKVDYDTLDIIGIEYGLTDYNDQLKKGCDLFRLELNQENGGGDMYQKQSKNEQYTHNDIHILKPKQEPEKPERDYTNIFREAQKHITETNYPQQRGLSAQIIDRFKLGYNSNFYDKETGTSWKALIIPTGKGSFTVRNLDKDADHKNRYRKIGSSQLYNAKALKNAQKPIFIVESELDALSIIEVGGEAVALGSTANLKKFLELMEIEKPGQPLIIALDNDDEGEKTADQLIKGTKFAKGLQELDIPNYKINISGDCKDANEALNKDRDAFKDAIKGAEIKGQEAIIKARELYLKNSTASHLQNFMNGINDSVNTPCIPTGYNKLDDILEGGLYEGLYIIGAISSLGKTTLITQIADQIAEAGNDVLIFSLEMARAELMAKSISRLTLLNVLQNGGNTRDAKTARGITAGKRYKDYSQKEIDLIKLSIDTYGKYAQHIFINEGVGDIGTARIKQEVENHIKYTGNKPVVIIDYLQILAPYSDRMNDKQNTDKAVMELKRISRDHKIPVIGISSFNRSNYKEAVTMLAFKESGAIEYSSDVLIGLQLKGAGTKDFNEGEQKEKNPRDIELVILKNRNGKTGKKVNYEYYPQFNYFEEK